MSNQLPQEILLVEDQRAHALLIRRAFEAYANRYVIKLVSSLQAAREVLAEHQPALVVADYRLPDGDGTELLSNNTPAMSFPIVIMTGHGDEQLAVEAMRAGALDYVVKSEASMAEMPRIAERALREWSHIQQRRIAEEALRLSEERYALAAKGANDGLWDWNLGTNRVYYSNRWKAMLGFSEDEVSATPEAIYDRVHPDDLGLLKAAINSHLEGGSPHLECECRMRHRRGEYRWMLLRGLAVRNGAATPSRLAGSLTDITERKLAEQQLQHNALHDPLTDLPNRALFLDRLSVCLERSKRRDDYLFAVLFVDLDRFKVVNDSLGHVMGDQLLQQVAERLLDSLRNGDTVARLGGDEFAVVLDGIDHEEEAKRIARRIASRIEQVYELAGNMVFTTASVGIALGGPEYRHAEDIIRDADTAMYRAKGTGRGRYEVFKRTMRMDSLGLLQLENELRQAHNQQQLLVYYQPIVSLQSGKLKGFEALVRWQHPTRGLLPPRDFVPLAEETGLINSIDHKVLLQACTDLVRWQQEFSLPQLAMSANLSGKQVVEADLVERILGVLKLSSLNPTSLTLEITENLVMENAEIAARLVASLKAHGIGLAMDDFGTGYSSLSYLHRFPVDTLKIDRSFVSRMDTDESGLEIVRTIIALARSLQMSVTAEGVENAKQLKLLRDLQCNNAQGFYFSKPLDAIRAEALLRANPQWSSSL
jgi:diguanylate cyclase (GGDEF)-like protein/PAS domain S-box-containing protein